MAMLSAVNRQDVRDAVMRSELKALTDETVAMNKYRSYFDGEQELVYSTALFREVFGDAFEGFRDNWMKVIVNAVNNRMKLINFHFDNDEDSTISSAIWDVMKRNEMNVQQRDLHEGIMVEGRAFVIVWPDAEKGAFIDWQPGQLCRVFYNPDRRTEALWAVKRWTTEMGEVYVTFYTPENVYKYMDESSVTGTKKPSSSSALTEVPEIGHFAGLKVRRVEGEPWPLENPFNRVPVIEFNNTSYRSELTDAIPQQDALNKTLLDMMVTSEFQAFPQRAIETMSSQPEGGWQAGAGEVWHFRPSYDPDGKVVPSLFHEFSTSDPSTYMEPISMWLQHIALTNSTPVRYFQTADRGGRGDAESGDALLVDDKPLNDKTEDKQERWDPRWMDVARLVGASINIPNALNLTGDSVWQDPRHDFRTAKLNEGLIMVTIGIPVEFVIRQLGFTPAEVTELLALIEEQKEEQKQAEKDAQKMAENASVDESPTRSSTDAATA